MNNLSQSKLFTTIDKPALLNQIDKYFLDQAQHMFLPLVHNGLWPHLDQLKKW